MDRSEVGVTVVEAQECFFRQGGHPFFLREIRELHLRLTLVDRIRNFGIHDEELQKLSKRLEQLKEESADLKASDTVSVDARIQELREQLTEEQEKHVAANKRVSHHQWEVFETERSSKLRNLGTNGNVAPGLDVTDIGRDVIRIEGTAVHSPDHPRADQVPASNT